MLISFAVAGRFSPYEWFNPNLPISEMFGFELELTRDMFISQLLPDWSWSMSVLIKDLITMQSDYMFGIFNCC